MLPAVCGVTSHLQAGRHDSVHTEYVRSMELDKLWPVGQGFVQGLALQDGTSLRVQYDTGCAGQLTEHSTTVLLETCHKQHKNNLRRGLLT